MAASLGFIRERRRTDDGISYQVDIQGETDRYRIGAIPMGGRWMPLHSRDLAEMALSAIRADIAGGKSIDQACAPFVRKPTAGNMIPAKLSRFLERERERCASGDISPTTLKELERWCNPGGHFSYWEGRAIFGIRYGELEDWRSWLFKRKLGAKTVKNSMGQFRTFLRWLKRRGDLDSVPDFPPVPVDTKPPEILTLEGQRAVIEAIPWERRGAFMAAAHTLRPNEVRAIKLCDYRQTNMYVQAAVKGQGLDAPIRGAKERNWRVVGADEELQAWIEWRREQATAEERLHGQVPLFPNPLARNANKRWTTQALIYAWNKAAKEVGVTVSMYPGTKHTTATDLIRRGEARETVQALLGHADPRSTDHYVVLADHFVTDTIRRRSVTGPSKPKNGPRK